MSTQPQPTLGEAAKTALEYRLRNGLPLDAPCDIYELIVGRGVELRFMEVKSLEGFYISEGTAGQINVCAYRPSGLQHFTAAHELGHHVFGHGSTFDLQLDYAGRFSSISAEERLAELFARYLLMPRRAVYRGFKNIGADLKKLTGTDIYRVASWLGVGYATLIHQMRWSLQLLDQDQFDALIKQQPQEIKQALASGAGRIGRAEVWPADPSWNGSRIHAEIGDLLTGVKSDDSGVLASLGDNCQQAMNVGCCTVELVGGGQADVSVCRKEYVGFYEYRYLPEPNDA
jgi:Zn-dependent peptidase ImmA (M78 family)